MFRIPYRQIHLDFHTSPLIPDVGTEFDAAEFARTLKAAEVEAINIFAKCHHGYAYYPSKVFPMHPSLKFDLLGQMIDALHAEEIQCPIYISVQWDEYAAATHPEWMQLDSRGKQIGREPYSDGIVGERWKYLCVNTGYLDYFKSQLAEVLDRYRGKIDGIWFDILKYNEDGCSCRSCIDNMEEDGLDPANLEDRRTHTFRLLRRVMGELSAMVREKAPEARIYFNGRQRIDADPARSMRNEVDSDTHLEIESLASGEWGYNHFPMFVRYNQIFGKELIGMNGRFHKSWADFGGLKNPAALEYECFNMIANTAKVCIGDQLHPRGKLDPATYDLVGNVFRRIREKEPWCEGANPVADIACFIANDGEYGPALRPRIRCLEGAMQMLLEDHRQFQIIDRFVDFSRYRLILFPDKVRFPPDLAEKVKEYLAKGGRAVLSYESGLTEEGNEFALDLGAGYRGDSGYRTTYLRLGDELAGDLPRTDYVVYDRGAKVEATGADTLASVVEPYFDRTWREFMSHEHTPPDRESRFAGALRKGNVIYFSHPLCTAYRKYGNLVYKRIVTRAIDLLLGDRLIESNLPSTAQLTMTDQPERGRQIVHVLHYPKERRAQIDIIEDVIPLHQVQLSVKRDVAPKRVYLAPTGEELPFRHEAGRISFTVPEVLGHAMIVIEV